MVGEDPAKDSVVGYSQFSSHIIVIYINDFNGVCENGEGMRFKKSQHYQVVRAPLYPEDCVETSVEALNPFVDAAVELFK